VDRYGAVVVVAEQKRNCGSGWELSQRGLARTRGVTDLIAARAEISEPLDKVARTAEQKRGFLKCEQAHHQTQTRTQCDNGAVLRRRRRNTVILDSALSTQRFHIRMCPEKFRWA
jgi:hypothetical protein